MNFQQLIEPFFLLFLGTFLGFLFGKFFHFPSKPFSSAVNFVFMPFLVFSGLIDRELNMQYLLVFIAYFSFILLLIFIAFFWSKFFPLEVKENAIFRLTSVSSNTGNFGIPLCVALFGSEVIAIIAFIILANQIMLNIFGVFFISQGKKNIKKSFLDILKMPVLWAITLSLLIKYFSFNFSSSFFEPIKTIGLTTIPLAIFTFGLSLSGIEKCNFPLRLFLQSSFLRLILSPLVMLIILKIFNLEKNFSQVLFVESTVPLAIFTIILADIYSCSPQKASSIVLASTILSIFTISFWLVFILPKV